MSWDDFTCPTCGNKHNEQACPVCVSRLKEPQAPNGTPAREPSAILSAYRTNLEWATDCASLKLNRLKPGSSAAKTQGGIVRGLQEALGALKAEMGEP